MRFLATRRSSRRSRQSLVRPRAEGLESRTLLASLSFSPPASVAFAAPTVTRVADFNGDGLPDLLFVQSDASGARLATLAGTGGGRFATPVVSGARAGPGDIELGDFDRDGALDVVRVDRERGAVALARGDGRGGFGEVTSTDVGPGPAVPVAADFDHDGRLDLALTGAGGGVRILLGNGFGAFAEPVVYPGGAQTRDVVTGDFNRDGSDDLVASTNSNSVAVFLNDGSGRFSSRVVDAGLYAASIDGGDFDGDGKLDVVVDSIDDTAVLRGDGLGGFARGVVVPDAARGAFAAADFNLDGVSDLAIPSADGQGVSILAGVAGGPFAAPLTFHTGIGSGVTAADFDGDGRPDAANYPGNGTLTLLLNKTPGAPSQTFQAEFAGLGGPAVSTADGGFTGAGYVVFADDGGFVDFKVNAPADGQYLFRFRYANGGTTDPDMQLSANFQGVPVGINFPRTGSWRTWSTAAVMAPLAAGVNFVRLSAIGQGGPHLDALAVSEGAPPPTVTCEAETARLSGPLAMSNHTGFTGTGFADYQHARGDFVQFLIDVDEAGDYSFDIRYANGSPSNRPLELRVDGTVVNDALAFAPTGSWRTWRTVSQALPLTVGRHTVRLTATGSNGPNLDSLNVTRRAAPQPLTLQAETAILSGPTVARNHAGFTGSGFADYQRASGDYVQFTVDAPSAGRYLLQFRYANGSASDRPMDLKVNGAAAPPALSFAPTGSWSRWSTSSATVTLAAGTNRVRLTAAGRSGPNLDALTVGVAPTQGVVSYLSQARSVGSGLNEVYEVYNPDTDEFDEVRESAGDGRAAPDFGPFDAAISAQVDPPAGMSSGIAAGSQHSRLTDGGIFVSGEFNGHTATDFGGYGIESNLDVTFELDRALGYRLSYTIHSESTAFPRVRTVLSQVGGATIFQDVRQREQVFTGTSAGTLAAGRYRLVMEYQVGGDVGMQGPYTLQLALTP
jgi:uncharacterized protein YegP (UPF0339 family)